MKKVKEFIAGMGLEGVRVIRPSTNSRSKWRRALEGRLLACYGVPGLMALAVGCRKDEQLYFVMQSGQGRAGLMIKDLSPGMMRRAMAMPLIEGDAAEVKPAASLGEIEMTSCRRNPSASLCTTTYLIEVMKVAPIGLWHSGMAGPVASSFILFTNYIHYIPWPLARSLTQGAEDQKDSAYEIKLISNTLPDETVEKIRSVIAAGKL